MADIPNIPKDAKAYLWPIPTPSAAVSVEPCLKGDGPAFALVRLIVRVGVERIFDQVLPTPAALELAKSFPEPLAVSVASQYKNSVSANVPLHIAGKDMNFDMPRIMGVVNVTPDSFSDGGDFLDADAAIAHGKVMVEAGANILDIGGESTRPGADVVSIEAELERVIPVVSGLAHAAPISIDTRNAAVMSAALDAGAAMVNDVTALTHDPEALAVVAERNVPVCLMHAQGTPQDMQKNPQYADVCLDIFDYLEARRIAVMAAGVKAENIILDPGIGFGKTLAHNLQILSGLSLFHGLGAPVLLGASRKSFIGMITGEKDAKKRLAGSLMALGAGVRSGVQIYRVHDVYESHQALAVEIAMNTAFSPKTS